MMREWCLINAEGRVINMAMTHRPSGPVMGNAEAARGLRWVPVSQVSQARLNAYEFWNSRP